jgi:DNA-binding protein H-NS
MSLKKCRIFSKMTVDALITARSTIDDLLKKRLPAARKELEDRLNALSNCLGGESERGRKAKADGRSKLKGRRIAPKYRGRNGETWSGRGMMPRWLKAAVRGGAKLNDFAIGTGGRRNKGKRAKRASAQSAKKRPAAKGAAPKRQTMKSTSEATAPSASTADNAAA